MSNLNPPFRVGDEVICVNDSRPKGVYQLNPMEYIRKWDKYTILGTKIAKCGCWVIDIGVKVNFPPGVVLCIRCRRKYWDAGDIVWFDPSRFRLLPPSYENISKELAGRAMEVGDGQDLKPVRKEVLQ